MPDPPEGGHGADDGDVGEAVSLGKVRPAVEERRHERRDERRIHLAVAVELDDDVGAQLEGALETGLRAPPTPRFVSCLTRTTRGSDSADTAARMSSGDASSTTMTC